MVVIHSSICTVQSAYGDDSPQQKMATTINDIGVWSYSNGDFKSALKYFEKACELRQKLLGDHPETAQSLNNIAAIHFQNQDFATCAMYVHRAIAIAKKCLGPVHPTTLDYQRGLKDTQRKLKQRRNVPK
jgi:Tfp pilus assembly protein PilF